VCISVYVSAWGKSASSVKQKMLCSVFVFCRSPLAYNTVHVYATLWHENFYAPHYRLLRKKKTKNQKKISWYSFLTFQMWPLTHNLTHSFFLASMMIIYMITSSKIMIMNLSISFHCRTLHIHTFCHSVVFRIAHQAVSKERTFKSDLFFFALYLIDSNYAHKFQ
jgi:hypothetical protein